MGLMLCKLYRVRIGYTPDKLAILPMFMRYNAVGKHQCQMLPNGNQMRNLLILRCAYNALNAHNAKTGYVKGYSEATQK